jgi:hypothetical protein
MDSTRVTVLMAAYNAADYIREAIESVLAQTFEHFECLVVDDGSTDSTAEVVRSYTDPRVKVVALERNSGAAAARNEGLHLAKADLVAILDADDIAYPRRLERQVEYMDDHPNCSLLGCAYDLIDATGAIQGTARWPCETAVIRWQLLTRNVIGHSTVMLRRGEALSAGGYKEGLRNGQDYALWTVMAPLTEVAQLPEVLVAYRDNPQGLTRTRTLQDLSDSIGTSQAALSIVSGREISFEATACLYGMPPASGLRRARCLEVIRALAGALQTMVACDPTARGLELNLVRDWRKQVERLGAMAPSVLPQLVALSTRLSLQTVGIRGLGAGYSTWLLRSLAFSIRSVTRRIRGFDEFPTE